MKQCTFNGPQTKRIQDNVSSRKYMRRKIKLRGADGFPVFQLLVVSLSIIILVSSKWDIIDSDDDNDGILDEDDLCPKGRQDWTSTSLHDWDSDGCHDWFEDYDDDNDGMPDLSDDCRTGDLGWTSNSTTDYDTDGCQDSNEDIDSPQLPIPT